jgi:hypothetical protein
MVSNLASEHTVVATVKATKDGRKLPSSFIAMLSSFCGLTYTFNVPYGVAKADVDRFAKDMAVVELAI